MSSLAPGTPYDLSFRLLNVPVRVHPLFWLVTAILGWNSGDGLMPVVLWIACVFLSILVHEFGHALTARRFGGSPSILLYGLGGLCYSGTERTPGQRLAVILAGPGAGFLLLLLTLLAFTLLRGVTPAEHAALVPRFLGIRTDDLLALSGQRKFGGPVAFEIYVNLVWINLFWTLINLLPIWPLDGGQATQVVMTRLDPRHGVRRSHIVSFATAGVLAVLLGLQTNDMFLALFMGYFAYQNYLQLQIIHETSRYGRQDDDWWRN